MYWLEYILSAGKNYPLLGQQGPGVSKGTLFAGSVSLEERR